MDFNWLSMLYRTSAKKLLLKVCGLRSGILLNLTFFEPSYRLGLLKSLKTQASLTFSVLLSLALPVSFVAGTGSVQAPVEDVAQQHLLLAGQLSSGRGQEAAPVCLHVILSSPVEPRKVTKCCLT